MAAVEEVDVYESWEDMDEIGLDRKFSKLITTSPEQCNRNSKMSNGGTVKVVFDVNDSLGTQIMAQQPSVKILKRPSGVNGTSVNENKARPVKTFQQRQQEYEQARLRILGEARSPEDVLDTKVQLKLDAHSAPTINRIQEKLSTERVTPTSEDISLPSPTQPRIIAPPSVNMVSVLRSPLGPDGTKGFHLRR